MPRRARLSLRDSTASLHARRPAPLRSSPKTTWPLNHASSYLGVQPVSVSATSVPSSLDSAPDGEALGNIVDAAIVVLIVLNVAAVIIESVESIASRYTTAFQVFELFSVAVFSLEYLGRLWLSSARVAPGDSRWRASLHYVCSLHGLIDLIAILPFYLGMFINADLRFLRVLRLVRILKLTRYSPAAGMLLRAIRREQQAFSAAIYLLAIALVVASSGIYLCEHTAQPEAFGSIPAAIWWAIATLTTVGYGDVTPITIGGKIFGAGVMIVGVGMVALPTGILASTFADELRRRREDFTEVADSALEDGELSHDEHATLEALREQTGLSREEAERIVREVRSRKARSDQHCPHCGAQWQPGTTSSR